ncbi:hypothetical protein PAE4_30309 [Bacillus altitudinis]|nr:hypothetical protein PAE4_30309 [Bacillus altitudinis]
MHALLVSVIPISTRNRTLKFVWMDLFLKRRRWRYHAKHRITRLIFKKSNHSCIRLFWIWKRIRIII